ncbi:MAG: hypothetical protein ABSH19_07340 [Opitutales bacterium]
MSEPTFHGSSDHHRRIRDLEHLADVQRDYFSAQLADLSDSLQPVVVARNVFSRLAGGISFASRFLGKGPLGLGVSGLLAALGGDAALAEKTRETRFPWKSVLVVGAGLFEVGRWLKRKRHG